MSEPCPLSLPQWGLLSKSHHRTGRRHRHLSRRPWSKTKPPALPSFDNLFPGVPREFTTSHIHIVGTTTFSRSQEVYFISSEGVHRRDGVTEKTSRESHSSLSYQGDQMSRKKVDKCAHKQTRQKDRGFLVLTIVVMSRKTSRKIRRNR